MRYISTLWILAALAWTPDAAHSQLTTPPHWRYVTDEPARLVTEQAVPDSAWRFVAMPPGWHVTTGPAAILYDPAYQGQGRFTIEAKLILFPNPRDAEYGVFVGGKGLDTRDRQALAFLIRRDGHAAVGRLTEKGYEWVVPWTRYEAVGVHEGRGLVENVVRVSAGPDAITFAVNGDTLTTVPRADGDAEGPFGFRIGAGLNMHVTYLDLTQHLALPRPRG